ncbi:hypothetical protein G7068_06900 [Leucobacter viscericola]|uniref:Uncharacterized protein n=1 Tax=Leucobacter viscericola TaxID=2714935 RepID=A0A6G7XED7_9MICO|nr:hypothetical protein [Leucobacter viscericola]QIK62954.1 hypothetical protein G7068_06900 [Leucobacter viscericola]
MSAQDEAIGRATQACAEAANNLTQAGIRPETLATYIPPRKAFLRTKPAKFEPLGEVWRLGTLLLTSSGDLYAAGSATRSAERGRPGYQSNSREERREIAAAALKAGYPIGTPVNYDAIPLPLNQETLTHTAEDLPLALSEGEVRVRWRAGAPIQGAQTLQSYLAERVTLLVEKA